MGWLCIGLFLILGIGYMVMGRIDDFIKSNSMFLARERTGAVGGEKRAAEQEKQTK